MRIGRVGTRAGNDVGIERSESAALRWALDRLLLRCARDGVTVLGAPGAEGAWWPGCRAIVLNTTSSLRVLVHSLLHELGHRSVDGSRRDRWRNDGQEGAVSADDVLSVLDEEIEAWERGWDIAVGMHLDLDPAGYARTRRRALVGYVRWAHSALEKKSRRRPERG